MSGGPLRHIAERCIAECDAAGHKGKRADNFAFDFMSGAMFVLAFIGDEDDRNSVNIDGVMLIVGTRGMKAVRGIATPHQGDVVEKS